MLQESFSQFIQFVLWFSLIEALISGYWLSKAPCCAEGIGASAQPISTPGFEMIKRAVRWVRGKRMNDVGDANSFAFKHSLRRGEWEAERNLNERGSFSSQRRLKSSTRLGKGGKTESVGEMFMREKRVIIWGIFVKRRRWLPAHVWILFWQQYLRKKQSWWDLWDELA